MSFQFRHNCPFKEEILSRRAEFIPGCCYVSLAPPSLPGGGVSTHPPRPGSSLYKARTSGSRMLSGRRSRCRTSSFTTARRSGQISSRTVRSSLSSSTTVDERTFRLVPVRQETTTTGQAAACCPPTLVNSNRRIKLRFIIKATQEMK